MNDSDEYEDQDEYPEDEFDDFYDYAWKTGDLNGRRNLGGKWVFLLIPYIL